MASRQKVRWTKDELPKNREGWSISGDRPLRSPYPHTNNPTDIDDKSNAVKFVLSIDGGGIRGYSSLVILQSLMEELGKIERAKNPKATSSICSSSALGPPYDETCTPPNPDAMLISEYRPCHYFDFITGTGTGAIIAMMLGKYRMSVGEAMESYRGVCATIVERQLTSPSPKRGNWRSVFSGNHKASRWSKTCIVKMVPPWPSPNEEEGDLQSDGRCRTIVCNANSYYNNPSRTVLSDISCLPDHTLSGNNGIHLLSIGGAINGPVDIRADKSQHHMSEHIRRVHERLSTHPCHHDLSHCCRLDVPGDDLRDIPVDEWKPQESNPSTLRRIEEATNAYLRNEDVATNLHEIAAALVEKRVQRAKTRQREWRALGVVYRCFKVKCRHWNGRFGDNVRRWVHMLKVHGVKHEDYNGVTKRGYAAMGWTREGR